MIKSMKMGRACSRNWREDLDLAVKVIMGWRLDRQYGLVLTGFMWLGIGTSKGFL
jgi:hypothetical protein